MRERRLIALPALCLALCGCLGGESEGPPPEARIAPGSYVGDYSYIPDSLRQGFEEELILERDGTYRSLWVQDSEAVYDEHGSWSQQGQNLFMRHSTENWADYHVFYPKQSKPIEDDTCALARLTDTSFVRNEWIPVVLRKRQWTNFRLKTYPKLAEGTYTFSRIIDSIPKRFQITLTGDQYRFSVFDSVESNQSESRFYQLGSFLALQETRDRDRDSTGAWGDWASVDGLSLQRLRGVTDTAFDLWNPGYGFLPPGWDHYAKAPK